MKKLISVLLLGILLLAYPTKSLAKVCSKDSKDIMGPIDHWPWGAEVTFPWRGIQGVWSSTNTCANYYSFKVVKKEGTTEKILQIQEFDPYSCRVISRGVGTVNNRVLTAVMASATKPALELTVHVFKEEDVDRANRGRYKEPSFASRNVTVMTLNEIGSFSAKNSMELIKIRGTPGMICEE